MKEVFLPLASETRVDAVKAQVPVNALRCIMNIVAGADGIGMMTYHQCNREAALTLIKVIKVRRCCFHAIAI